MAFQIALERVQVPTRKAHPAGVRGCIQDGKLAPELLGVRGLNPRLAARIEELLQPRVPERPDHVHTVARSAPRVKVEGLRSQVTKRNLGQVELAKT